MKRTIVFRAIAAVIIASMGLTGCAGNPNAPILGQGAGMVTGGILGGAIGKQIGGREGMIAGAILGAAIGGMIGYEIGRSLSEQDRKVAHQKFALGLSENAAGQKHTWTTPDNSATVNYTAQAEQIQSSQTRLTRASNVEAPSELDVIAAPHKAPIGVDVRSRPGKDGKSVAKLAKGEEVMVVGQVTGQPWYLVSRNSQPIGYVETAKLQAIGKAMPGGTILTAAAPITEPPVGSGLVASDIRVRTACRGMDYDIVKQGNSAENGSFMGCKQIDGNWLVQQQQQPQLSSAG